MCAFGTLLNASYKRCSTPLTTQPQWHSRCPVDTSAETLPDALHADAAPDLQPVASTGGNATDANNLRRRHKQATSSAEVALESAAQALTHSMPAGSPFSPHMLRSLAAPAHTSLLY